MERQISLSDVWRDRGAVFDADGRVLAFDKGALAEHLHTRHHASLMDLGSLTRVFVAAEATDLEPLVAADLAGLAEGEMCRALLTDEEGGVADDLMAWRDKQGFILTFYRGGEAATRLEPFSPQSRGGGLAFYGPKSGAVLARLFPEVATLRPLCFCHVASGEDAAVVAHVPLGDLPRYEIWAKEAALVALAQKLLDEVEVLPAGGEAAESLRIEAGLPLIGRDMTPDTSPCEAGIAWAIAPGRRETGGFPGAAGILAELREGPARSRLGFVVQSLTPIAMGDAIFANPMDRMSIAAVTSSAFSPVLGAYIGMALLPVGVAMGDEIWLQTETGRVKAVVTRFPLISAGG